MGKGIVAIAAMNLRNIPRRRGAALVVVVGIAGVVSVLLSFLAMAAGMQHVVNGSARADRVMILTKDARSEAASSFSRSDALTLMEAAGILRDQDGKVVSSGEVLTVVPIARPGSKFDNYISLRGIGAQAMSVRPEMKIVQGRMFRSGVHELVIGLMASGRFPELTLGSHLRFEGGDWTIVGIFESGGDSHESELMADAETVMSAFRRNSLNSVTALLESPASLETVKDFIATNPTLSVQVEQETAYYTRQTKTFHTVLTTMGYIFGGFMGIGAFFGAMNSLYSTVSARRVEIATLRAIGFSPVVVVTSVLVEAIFLAVIGALLGALIAWALFNGNTLSSAGGSFSGSGPEQFAQRAFPVLLTFPLTIIGVVWAVALGLIGAIAPALNAARLPIATALRRL